MKKEILGTSSSDPESKELDEEVTTSETTSERELIQRSQEGDSKAFDALVIKYQDRVYNAAFRIVGNLEDASDVAQEAFIKAYRSLKNFKGDANFYTWMFRITVNTAISLQRKKSRKSAYSLEDLNPHSRGASDGGQADQSIERPDESLEKSETHQALHRAIQELPDEYRVSLVLKDLEGLGYEEIAQVLEVPKGTVKSRIHRARELLREKLKDLVR